VPLLIINSFLLKSLLFIPSYLLRPST